MRSGAPAVHGNSYENTFSAVISSPYLHLLAGLDRRKRIFIRYGEPQAHGNSVVNQSPLEIASDPHTALWAPRFSGRFRPLSPETRGSSVVTPSRAPALPRLAIAPRNPEPPG